MHGQRWIKSSRSEGGAHCVEVQRSAEGVRVRDSKLGDASPILTPSPDDWTTFLGGIHAGRFQ